MRAHLKYITARPSLKNPKRWYWQCPGHPLVRLPDDFTARITLAQQLTDAADKPGANREGCTAWVVDKYAASDEYDALKPGTKKYYKRMLADIRRIAPDRPFAGSWTRRAVIEFVNTYKAGLRKQAGAVLRNLFNVAIYHGHATINHARDLRLKGGGRRHQIWAPADAVAWLAKCRDPAMTLAFYLMRFTVQRPNDCLTMNWTQYNGDTIKLTQEKTGKLLEVTCHAELKTVLDEARKATLHTRIVSSGLRGLRYNRFSERFRRIANAAGLNHLQARDLRRSAAVYMAEAGCTTPEIAAIGGWSIEKAQQILETYLPRSPEMGRAAIRKWEQKDAKS